MLTENNNDLTNLVTDEFVKEANSLRKQGKWVKYGAEPGNWNNKNANYVRLYNDLKDSNKDWDIAKDVNACQDELCGEMIPSEGISSGDIYVFYEKENDKDVPVFYLKIRELNENSSYIEFNGSNSVFYGIDCKYLSEIIVKLIEIDKNMHKKYIDDLKIRYVEYNNLLSLLNKDQLTDDEINFIYYMAFSRYEENAINKINDRDVAADFKNFDIDNKIKLYLNIIRTDKLKDIVIDSKEVLLGLAKAGHIKQLNNATEEIINDKEFVIELLNTYFSVGDMLVGRLVRSIPKKYQNDMDILNCIINNMPTACISIADWISKNHINCNNKEFAYKIISAYLGVSMKDKWSLEEREEIMLFALGPFSEEILSNVENHVLIGPQPNEEMELLKEENINSLIKSKKKVFQIRDTFNKNS